MLPEEDKSLGIAKNVWGSVLQHAVRDYPAEACGILLSPLAHRNHVVAIYPMKNREIDRRHERYMIDPQDLLQAIQKAESNELKVVGVYHSHPDHPVLPSHHDLKMALHDFVYLIISVNEGRVSEAKMWVLDDKKDEFREKPFLVTTKKDDNREVPALCQGRLEDPACYEKKS